MKQSIVWFAAACVALACAPLFFYPILVMKILCFALFASAFNLLIGYTGLLSFGHAAFLGVAGYIVGMTTKLLGLPPELALVSAVVGAGLLGLVIGGLAIRRQGIYFSMITLALSQLVYFVALQMPVTGRDDGFHGIPRGELFGVFDLQDDSVLYVVVATCFLLGVAGIVRIVNSPFGQVLTAIRENEARAQSLGLAVNRYKLLAFVLSAALSGLAGGLKALVLGYESLTGLHWSTSGEVILMTLLGGLGTILGPIIGAAFVVTLQNWLADKVGEWVGVIIGAVFLACVMAFRKGFVGELGPWLTRVRRRQRGKVPGSAKGTAVMEMRP